MMQERFARTVDCEMFEAQVGAYLEGEDRPEVAAHARQCSVCATVLSDLELLRAEARSLPLEDPPPVVWANIRATLEAEGAFRDRHSRPWLEFLGWLSHPARLAALAAMVLVGLFLTASPKRMENPRTPETRPMAEEAIAASAVTSPEDAAWARTVQDLEENYKAREAYLEPDLQATYRKSLDSLNSSIQECRVSLREEPTNTLARDYLLAAYSQKANLLTSAIEFSER